jgi:hypothetical protein
MKYIDTNKMQTNKRASIKREINKINSVIVKYIAELPIEEALYIDDLGNECIKVELKKNIL